MGVYHEPRVPQGAPVTGEKDVWLEGGEIKFGHWDGAAWVVDRIIGAVEEVDDNPLVDIGTDALAAEAWKEVLPFTTNMETETNGYFEEAGWTNYSSANPVRYRRLTNGRVELRGEIVSTGATGSAIVLLPQAYKPQYQYDFDGGATLKYYNGSAWVTPDGYVTVDADVTPNVAGTSSGRRIQLLGFTYAL